MVRGIGYRAAVTAFVFAGLWFVLGLLMLASPIPHALGIGSEMFVAWLAIFLAILAMAGASLTMAAINGLLPPAERAAPRSPMARATTPVRGASTASATHDADGRPLPWTAAPLPERAPRRTPSRPSDPGNGR